MSGSFVELHLAEMVRAAMSWDDDSQHTHAVRIGLPVLDAKETLWRCAMLCVEGASAPGGSGQCRGEWGTSELEEDESRLLVGFCWADVSLGAFEGLRRRLAEVGARVRYLEAWTENVQRGSTIGARAGARTQTREAFASCVRRSTRELSEACLECASHEEKSVAVLWNLVRPWEEKLALCVKLVPLADQHSPHILLDALERDCAERAITDCVHADFARQLLEASRSPYARITMTLIDTGSLWDPCAEYFLQPDCFPPRWLAGRASKIRAIKNSLLAQAPMAFVQPSLNAQSSDIFTRIDRQYELVCVPLVQRLLRGKGGLELAEKMRRFFSLQIGLSVCESLWKAPKQELLQQLGLSEWICWDESSGLFDTLQAGNALVNKRIIGMYNSIQSLLLRLSRTRRRLSGQAMPLRGKHVALLQFRSKALWFIGSLLDVLTLRISEDTWADIARTLADAQDADALDALHTACVKKLFDICLLGAKPLLACMTRVMGYCENWFILYEKNEHGAVSSLLENLDSQVHVFCTILSGILQERPIPYLQELIAAISPQAVAQ